MDYCKQRKILFSGRRKDSQVLEKDGKFHKGHSDCVGDGDEIDPLQKASASAVACVVRNVHT